MSMTKLEAVNRILEAIGEDPVSSLRSGLSDAEIAERFLDRTSKQIQRRGWHCNTEHNLRLIPDNQGYIYLPGNTLKVDSVGESGRIDVVKRGKRLYERRKKTFVFDQPIYVEIILELPWDDMDFALQDFISALAAQKYQASVMGSVALDQAFTSREVQEAWISLLENEADNEDTNIIDHSLVGRDITYRNTRPRRGL